MALSAWGAAVPPDSSVYKVYKKITKDYVSESVSEFALLRSGRCFCQRGMDAYGTDDVVLDLQGLQA